MFLGREVKKGPVLDESAMEGGVIKHLPNFNL